MNGIGWTDERTAELKRLWIEGKSAAEVAKALGGGVTRCAAIGKAHRLGLTASSGEVRQAASALKAKTPKPVRSAPPAAPRPAPASARGPLYINQGAVRERATDIPTPKLKTVQTDTPPRHWLTRLLGECAWPVSGEGASTLSCCAPTNGATYCAAHAALMHVRGRGSWASMAELARSVRGCK